VLRPSRKPYWVDNALAMFGRVFGLAVVMDDALDPRLDALDRWFRAARRA
jgi:hypothetical protein